MHLLAILLLAATPVSVESQLKAQTQELADAIAPGKAAVWQRYLDDDVVVTTEDGSVQTKSEILRDFRPVPEGVSGRIDVIDFHARVHDRVAIATYVMDEHETYHGQELHCQYRTTDTWLRKPDGWRLIASQVLALLGTPPAMRISDAIASSYAGTYELAPGITYEIRRDGQTLQGRRGENGKWETLLAEAPDVLFVPGKLRYRKIVSRDSEGKVTGFVDRREAWGLVWTKVK